ncbi:DUF6441 family protein [Pararoseomonas sp. SCSIO 73927]|uniref:DUF6441 family protein n=1 Tax=Pararoseomonas sp. SCSIO 73927 TaxID=3114537 RepID=UPI0030CC28E1
MLAPRISRFGRPMPDLLAAWRHDVATAVQASVYEAETGMTEEFRDDLGAAFPGSRRARTLVTGRVYPDRQGAVSINAAGSVVGRGGKNSPWPLPLKAFNEGAEIRGAAQGASLAIPTARVPRVGGRRMTVAEVEARFGEKLTFIPPKDGQRGAGMLVLEQQTTGRSGGVRRLSAGRVRQGRKAQALVMFVLVPKVKVPTRLHFEAIAKRWADTMPSILDRQASRIMGGRA